MILNLSWDTLEHRQLCLFYEILHALAAISAERYIQQCTFCNRVDLTSINFIQSFLIRTYINLPFFQQQSLMEHSPI